MDRHSKIAAALLAAALGGCGTAERAGTSPPAAPPADASHRIHPGPDAGADEATQKHLTFDENAVPANHADLLWGDYLDKQGKPALGWHSHDPIKGNAR